MENLVLLLHEPVSRFLLVPDRYCWSVFTNRAHRRFDPCALITNPKLATVIEYDNNTKNCILGLKSDIYQDSIWGKSASVETFWRHDVTWSSRYFFGSYKRWLFKELWHFTPCKNGAIFGGAWDTAYGFLVDW